MLFVSFSQFSFFLIINLDNSSNLFLLFPSFSKISSISFITLFSFNSFNFISCLHKGHLFSITLEKYFSRHSLQAKLLHFGHVKGSFAGFKHIQQFTRSKTL